MLRLLYKAWIENANLLHHYAPDTFTAREKVPHFPPKLLCSSSLRRVDKARGSPPGRQVPQFAALYKHLSVSQHLPSSIQSKNPSRSRWNKGRWARRASKRQASLQERRPSFLFLLCTFREKATAIEALLERIPTSSQMSSRASRGTSIATTWHKGRKWCGSSFRHFFRELKLSMENSLCESTMAMKLWLSLTNC